MFNFLSFKIPQLLVDGFNYHPLAFQKGETGWHY